MNIEIQIGREASQRTSPKLNNLYGSKICFPLETVKDVNLSTHQQTPEQEELYPLMLTSISSEISTPYRKK